MARSAKQVAAQLKAAKASAAKRKTKGSNLSAGAAKYRRKTATGEVAPQGRAHKKDPLNLVAAVNRHNGGVIHGSNRAHARRTRVKAIVSLAKPSRKIEVYGKPGPTAGQKRRKKK